MSSYCGISLRASICTIVLLTETAASLTVQATSKIELGDDRLQQQLISFRESVMAFFAVHKTHKALVKGRMQTGKFPGGFAASKMEAIIQSVPSTEIRIVTPQTVAAFLKKDHAPFEDMNLYKYYQEAFETSYYALRKN